MTGLRGRLGRVAARARGRRAQRRPPRGAGRAPPRRPGASTARRWLIGIPWAIVAVFVVVRGGTLLAILLIALGLVALHELYGMLEAVRPVRLAGFAGMAGLVLAAQYGDEFQIVMAAAGAVLLTFLLAMIDTRRHATLAIAATLMGVFWVGLALAHASLLRQLDHGDGLLIDVLVATFVGDIAAYFGGRLYGTTALAHSISPGKTVEGAICGLLLGTLGFWIAGWYQDWLSGADALAIGACVAAAAPFGDLFESMIKRDLGVKDAGRFFGEHGGALDRLDAAFVTVIVGYYAASAIL